MRYEDDHRARPLVSGGRFGNRPGRTAAARVSRRSALMAVSGRSARQGRVSRCRARPSRFGDAPRPQDPKGYGLSIIIDDVLGILDALQVREAQLVAHDWGAAVGWRLAAEHPVRITRYVALSVRAPGGPMPISNSVRNPVHRLLLVVGIAEKQLMANDWQLFREWARYTRTRTATLNACRGPACSPPA